MSSPSSSSHVGPFHRWHLGLLRRLLGAWAAPRPALGPAHCTPVQVPPYQALLLGGALRDRSCWVILELLMTLFAFPMTSNVPLPPDPTPMRVPSSPSLALSRRRGRPLACQSPALVQSPMCPWPWLLVLHGMVRWNAVPTGVVGLGVGRWEAIPSPAPESSAASLLGRGVGLGLSLRDSGPGELDSEGLSACSPNTCGENTRACFYLA